MAETTENIAVLGLGYVGLPLAIALARAGFATVGFDTDARPPTARRMEFAKMGFGGVRALGKPGAVLYDIKGVFGKSGSDLRL